MAFSGPGPHGISKLFTNLLHKVCQDSDRVAPGPADHLAPAALRCAGNGGSARQSRAMLLQIPQLGRQEGCVDETPPLPTVRAWRSWAIMNPGLLLSYSAPL